MKRFTVSLRSNGFSLIELLVTLVIGLVVVIAVAGIMSVSESRKRNTTSTNDVNLTGTFTLLSLDKAITSAGSGFAQSNALSYGCLLNAVKNGATVLPANANNLPAPFVNLVANLGSQFRLAPLIVAAGASSYNPGGGNTPSDVLIVMSGSSGYGEMPNQSLSPPIVNGGTGTLSLLNNISFQPNDLLLMTDTPTGPGAAPCLMEQVSPNFVGGTNGSLPLAGNFFTPAGATATLANYSADANVVNLGQTPSLMLYGVGANAALYSYDLLNGTPGTAGLVSEGVIDLRALYYVDKNGDGLAETWINPALDPDYKAQALMAGTAAANARLITIKAVQLGIIVRTTLQDTDAVKAKPGTPAAYVSPPTLKMFTDLDPSLVYTRTLSDDDRKYRYRVLETTVTLRNGMLTQ